MNIGKLQPTNITEEMKKSYLNYAMSVIVSRALPDVKDGLKPVHRRILFAMHEIGLAHSAKYKKSATVVGEVLGKYHPHGDVPVYDALVRLAQDFSMRYPLIDGQGNFGCFTKDTKVQLTDGRTVTFEGLVKENAEGKRNWTFAFNHKEQQIEIAEIKHPRLTIKLAALVEVTLDNGEKIRCTPNHKFMLRNGEYSEAENLKHGDSLMPLYLKAFEGNDNNLKGYTQAYQPETQTWDFVHHLSDQWNLKHNIYNKSVGKIRHHQDINKLNNNPDNIIRLPWEEHWLLHALLAGLRHQNDPEYTKKLAEGRKRYTDTHKDILSKRRSELNKKSWENKKYREEHTLMLKKRWENDEYREKMTQLFSERLKEKWQDPLFRERVSALKSKELKKKWQDPTYRKEMSAKMKALSEELWNDPHHRIKISEKMKKLASDPSWREMVSKRTLALWQDDAYRKKFSKEHFSNMAKTLWENEAILVLHSKKAKNQWEDKDFRQKAIQAITDSNKKRLTENPNMMVSMNQKAIKSLQEKWKDPEYKARVVKSKTLRFVSALLTRYKNITPAIYEKERQNNGTPKLKNALLYFTDFSEIITKARVYNHKVVSVKHLSVKEDVYDLTIDTWHNFALASGIFVHNSVDGDPPAAMRYTEARMAAITAELLTDIEKETVDFMPNFDASKEEPVYLPAKLPNLLLMGSEGIAVGMATKIPPHNLGELIDAITYMLGKTKAGTSTPAKPNESEAPVVATSAEKTVSLAEPKQVLTSDVTIDELLEFIKGPDFPTAGAIYDITEIKSAYITGRGKIVIRGKAEIEEIGQGKSAITITELPYQVNKALLIAKIADLAKEKKIDGISDLRDESDRRGLRIYVELKRDATPKKVLNNLFKHTSLQTTFPVNMVALVDGTPQTMNLKLILEEYIKHRYEVIRRRSEFELKQAKARLHILEGLKIAVDNIDAVIQTIRASKTQEEAKENLMKKFKLSEIQATAILDMQLRRLAALERQKIEDELQMVRETIAYLEDLLAHGEKILAVIKNELNKLKEKYADPRRTKVFKGKVGEFSEEDLIPNEPTVITLTTTGYIKRQSLNAFHTQHRGGKGITGMNVKEEDGISHIRSAQTHDNILFFTNKGKAYALRAYEIAESSRTSKGSAIVNLLNIEAGEKVESFVVYGKDVKDGYVFLTTRNGTVKKTHINEFDNIRRNGMIAIKLDPGDELAWSNLTDGKSNVLIITRGGKAIKFNEDAVRPLGRATMGVRGIKIDSKDQVIGMDVITKGDNPELFVIMENGLGKKTPVDQFPLQNRGGQGVKVAKVTDRTGEVITAQIIPSESEEIIITSKKGQIVKLAISSIPKLSRDTQGVILMRFSHASDGIASATCLMKE